MVNYPIDKVHDWIDFICNKKQSSYFTPPEKDLALHNSQMDVFLEYKKVFAKDQVAQDALAPFKAIYSFTAADTVNGVITMPSNYQHLLSINPWIGISGQPHYLEPEEVGEDAWAGRLNSQVRSISEVPIFRETAEGVFQMQPNVTYQGEAYYLKTPTPPVYGYSQNGRVITYNAGTSTQFQWNDDYIPRIMMGALQYLGVSVDDITLEQITQFLRNKPL